MANDSLASAAIAAEGSGNWEAALGLWRQARLLDPHDSRIVQATARCLRCLGRHPEATVLLEQQLRLQPEALPLQLAVVEGLIDAGEVQQALRQLQLLLQASGDAAALTPLLDRLARLLLPADHPALVASPTELLQALQPVLPGHLLLLDGCHDDAVAAVATQLEASGWQWLQRDSEPVTAAHDLANGLATRCGAAAVVLIHARRSGAPAMLWQTLAQQRGLNLAVVLVVSHPLQSVQRQRRRGISAQQSLQEWLHWAHSAAQPGVACEVLPYDTRRLPLLKAQALPWIDGAAPDPELLLQALELHQALMTAKPPGEVRATPATAATVVQWLVDAAAREQHQGECRWAEWLLRLALELQPQQQGLYPALARCLRLQDRSGEAESLLRRHLVDDPLSAPGHIGLAELERERGRWQAAIDHYGEALALDPGHGGLPRALRHTAAHFFGPDDPRLEGTPEELLACLRPGIPQHILIVLGMHRSGTSAMAGMLSAQGWRAPAGSPPPDPFNPRGYFEPLNIITTHGVLLEEAGSRWDDPRLLPLGPTSNRLDLIAAALQADFPPCADYDIPIVVKDPRQCRLQALWNALIDQRGLVAAVVLVSRHPLAVARSLQRRDGLPIARSLLLWVQHQLAAERASRSFPRIRIDYKKLLADPAEVVRLCLGLVPGISLAANNWADISRNSIDQGLDHGGSIVPTVEESANANLLELASYVHGALNEPDEATCRLMCDQAFKLLDEYLDSLKSVEAQIGERGTAQLFWRTEESDFSELFSLRCNYPVERGEIYARLMLPPTASPLTGLRLDPAEQSGVIEIKYLSFNDVDDDLLWCWSCDSDEPFPAHPATTGIRFIESGGRKGLFLALDADPGLLLEVPSDVLRMLRCGGSLEFRGRVQKTELASVAP